MAALGHLHVCAVLLRMCFAKMLTSLVSLFDVWSNCSDAIASISSRCASNSVGKSRAEFLQPPAKLPSAALLIWHCTICSPFLIVNLNVIKWASYPTASPRVSGMNPAPSSSPVKAAEENGQWPRCQRLIASLPRTTVLWGPCPLSFTRPDSNFTWWNVAGAD